MRMKSLKNLFITVVVFALAVCMAGCGAGSGGNGNSNDVGAYSLSVDWPDSAEAGRSRIIPEGSNSMSVSITGVGIPSESPISTSIAAGITTTTITNIPGGPKVALIKALDSSGNILAQRKESFVINDKQTTTAEHIPLGIAVTDSGVFEPSSISVYSGETVYVQNWADSAVTVKGLGSDTPLAAPSTDSTGKPVFSQMIYSPTAPASVNAQEVANTANVIILSGFSDEFDGSINPGWTQVIQDTSTINYNSGKVNITAKLVSDLYSTLNWNAPRILQRVTGDNWTAETKLTGTFNANFQGAGILIQASKTDQTTIARMVEKSYNDQGSGFGSAGGVYNVISGNTVYFRLCKQGTLYSSYYSFDGTNWSLIGRWTGPAAPYYVGLYSINNNTGQNSVNFEYFRLTKSVSIGNGCVSDEFSSSSFEPSWTSIINGSSTISLASGLLTIKAVNPADLWTQTNHNAPRLIQNVSGNWTVETKLTGTFNSDYQGAGIMVQPNRNDPATITRAAERYYSTSNSIGSGVQNNGINFYSYTNSTVYLRVKKAGTTYTTYYSSDGTNWTTMGTFTGSNAPDSVGLFVISQWSSSQISVNYEYFRYTQQ